MEKITSGSASGLFPLQERQWIGRHVGAQQHIPSLANI